MEDANEHHVTSVEPARNTPSPPASGRLRYATRQLGVDHERPRLRAVLIAARAHAPRERVPSSDELAELVIDMAGELTARDRAVLAVMLGDLVRASRRDRGNDRRQLELFDRS
jgi:hypothetical protein